MPPPQAAASVYSARDRAQPSTEDSDDDDAAVTAAVAAAEQREQDEAAALKLLAEELDAQEVRSVGSYSHLFGTDGSGGGAAGIHENTQNLNKPTTATGPVWDAQTGAFFCYRRFNHQICSPQAPWQCHDCLKCMPPVAEQVVLHVPCPQCGCSMSVRP